MKTEALLGTGRSVVVDKCQICSQKKLESLLFVGYLPPVNTMPDIGTPAAESPFFPAELLQCPECKLVQLGCTVDAKILFPPHYAYTSGTTRILRDNFAELYQEVMQRYPLAAKDLVVDVGGNDGTLLSNFVKNHRVCNVEPTDQYKRSVEKGIPAVNEFFGPSAVKKVIAEHGKAKVVTATNVFAHIENVNEVVKSVLDLLDDKGVFISESHYLLPLVETVQYDTIYHEHLRYYSLVALTHLFEKNGLEVLHAKRIPTHGGSIRVYAARKGQYPVSPDVAALRKEEEAKLNREAMKVFAKRVVQSKLDLMEMLAQIKREGKKVYGISAPSRASTLIHYVGLEVDIIDCVLEIKGSAKIGKYMPGKRIPVVDEEKLVSDPPDYALLFSWHIGEELVKKMRQQGFKGKIIVPLPRPEIY